MNQRCVRETVILGGVVDIVPFQEGIFTYSHRLRPGVNRQSHSLKVAKMSGMPVTALEVASSVLNRLTSTKLPASRDKKHLRSIGESVIRVLRRS
jgi:DNA mismatch repair ATPase MutS